METLNKGLLETSKSKKFKTIQDCILYCLDQSNGENEGRRVAYSDDEIIKTIRHHFKNSQTSKHCIAWYRSKVNNGTHKLASGKGLPIKLRVNKDAKASETKEAKKA